MSNVKLNEAQERAVQVSEFPDYITTLGTELCLLPQLKRFSQALALECEQEILQDLGINEGQAHPQYSEGFDDGLRYAARQILRLLEAADE